MEKLCRLLEISRSGYYAWLTRRQGQRAQHNQALTRELVYLHEKYPALGLDSLYHMLKANNSCSRGRVHRLMKAAGIHSMRKKAYKATTNSRHSHPIAPNLLKRQFSFEQPNDYKEIYFPWVCFRLTGLTLFREREGHFHLKQYQFTLLN